jgi:Arc/MetJ-type ribon-helix-helix transcriptional regulator
MARLQSLVDLNIAARMDEARAALKRGGIFVSVSMFVEIALRELLTRRDLPEVMRRHKATARRDRD